MIAGRNRLLRNDQPGAVYARAGALGVVGGMRSQLPFALLALAANRGNFAAGADRPLSLLLSRGAAVGCGLAAVGELIGDKLPMTPSRLAPGPLAGRLVFGGLAGAAISYEAGRSALLGAALGAAGAGLGAAAGYAGRASLGRSTNVPDPLWGGVEDILAIGLGLAALRRR
jgi:uncharacterized membrane protein